MLSLRDQFVEVCRGRKVAVGTVAKCTWHGRTRFGWRVQLEFDDGSGTSHAFTDAENVRPLEGQPTQQSLFGAAAPAEDPGDIPF